MEMLSELRLWRNRFRNLFPRKPYVGPCLVPDCGHPADPACFGECSYHHATRVEFYRDAREAGIL